jgi:ABC-2 type transport system permease protein
MTGPLVRKLLRDLRLPLVVVAFLAAGFEGLWVKVSQRVTTQLAPFFTAVAARGGVAYKQMEEQVFRGPGRVVQTILGGEGMKFEQSMDLLSVGYIHPLVQMVLCVWAVGRAAGAVAGELDRGTMELLLAQPVARGQLILAHLIVDAITIPLLCLAMWGGTLAGLAAVGPFEVDPEAERLLKTVPLLAAPPADELARKLRVDPWAFGPALWNVGALVFAVSGATMWLSARGRFRWVVVGQAVLALLALFFVNLIGQLWEAASWLRPVSPFFYYQPQQIILHDRWTADLAAVWNGRSPLGEVNVLAVLFAAGAVGYLAAWWELERRDLPAPL